MAEEYNKFQYLREVNMDKTVDDNKKKFIRYRLKKVNIAQELSSIDQSVSFFEYTENQCSALAQLWAERELKRLRENTTEDKTEENKEKNKRCAFDTHDLLKVKLYQEDYNVVKFECLSFLEENNFPAPSASVKSLVFKAFLISKICVISAFERYLKSIMNFEVRLNIQIGLHIRYGKNPEEYGVDEIT